MDTLQIDRFFCHYPHSGVFQGVFPCDKLPKKITLPCAIIINLSKSNHCGSHWVSLYINREGSGDFMCSFGFQVRNSYIENFIRKHCKRISYNKKQLQHLSSNYCGLYAIIFIIHKMRGGTLHDFCNKFSLNCLINDISIYKQYTYYVKKLYL